MAGLIALQQGPFGVAASTPRPIQKPGSREAMRVAGTGGAAVNEPPSRHANPQKRDQEKAEPNQYRISPVSSENLIEASLIASALDLTEPASAELRPRAMPAWQPPASSLSLRDRQV